MDLKSSFIHFNAILSAVLLVDILMKKKSCIAKLSYDHFSFFFINTIVCLSIYTKIIHTNNYIYLFKNGEIARSLVTSILNNLLGREFLTSHSKLLEYACNVSFNLGFDIMKNNSILIDNISDSTEFYIYINTYIKIINKIYKKIINKISEENKKENNFVYRILNIIFTCLNKYDIFLSNIEHEKTRKRKIDNMHDDQNANQIKNANHIISTTQFNKKICNERENGGKFDSDKFGSEKFGNEKENSEKFGYNSDTSIYNCRTTYFENLNIDCMNNSTNMVIKNGSIKSASIQNSVSKNVINANDYYNSRNKNILNNESIKKKRDSYTNAEMDIINKNRNDFMNKYLFFIQLIFYAIKKNNPLILMAYINHEVVNNYSENIKYYFKRLEILLNKNLKDCISNVNINITPNNYLLNFSFETFINENNKFKETDKSIFESYQNILNQYSNFESEIIYNSFDLSINDVIQKKNEFFKSLKMININEIAFNNNQFENLKEKIYEYVNDLENTHINDEIQNAEISFSYDFLCTMYRIPIESDKSKSVYQNREGNAKEVLENAKEGFENAKEVLENAKEVLENAKEGFENAKEVLENDKEVLENDKEGLENDKEGFETYDHTHTQNKEVDSNLQLNCEPEKCYTSRIDPNHANQNGNNHSDKNGENCENKSGEDCENKNGENCENKLTRISHNIYLRNETVENIDINELKKKYNQSHNSYENNEQIQNGDNLNQYNYKMYQRKENGPLYQNKENGPLYQNKENGPIYQNKENDLLYQNNKNQKSIYNKQNDLNSFSYEKYDRNSVSQIENKYNTSKTKEKNNSYIRNATPDPEHSKDQLEISSITSTPFNELVKCSNFEIEDDEYTEIMKCTPENYSHISTSNCSKSYIGEIEKGEETKQRNDIEKAIKKCNMSKFSEIINEENSENFQKNATNFQENATNFQQNEEESVNSHQNEESNMYEKYDDNIENSIKGYSNNSYKNEKEINNPHCVLRKTKLNDKGFNIFDRNKQTNSKSATSHSNITTSAKTFLKSKPNVKYLINKYESQRERPNSCNLKTNTIFTQKKSENYHNNNHNNDNRNNDSHNNDSRNNGINKIHKFGYNNSTISSNKEKTHPYEKSVTSVSDIKNKRDRKDIIFFLLKLLNNQRLIFFLNVKVKSET
ncbi:hypothetical protein [Plasmodium yoelii yoelii]|uniref:Uncharacterized protein n=1 Tax=Plasmodium yoelii yoelii TaxID=73239 RepID=Q7RQN4_PLAYO|nr:hypothetical protein [Plasmodium yoelii yoelii]